MALHGAAETPGILTRTALALGNQAWTTFKNNPSRSITLGGLALWGGYEAIKQRSFTGSAQTILNTVREDFGIGVTVEKKLPTQIPIKSHIGHALRMFGYNHLLEEARAHLTQPSTEEDVHVYAHHMARYLHANQNVSFSDMVIQTPLKEDAVYTYAPFIPVALASCLRSDSFSLYLQCFTHLFAQVIMPINFAYGHRVTHSPAMMATLALKQFLKVRAFAVQPGYILTPLFNHMANNMFAYIDIQRTMAFVRKALQETQN